MAFGFEDRMALKKVLTAFEALAREGVSPLVHMPALRRLVAKVRMADVYDSFEQLEFTDECGTRWIASRGGLWQFNGKGRQVSSSEWWLAFVRTKEFWHRLERMGYFK